MFNIQSDCFKSETSVDICCWTYVFCEVPEDNDEQLRHGDVKWSLSRHSLRIYSLQCLEMVWGM